MSRFCHRWRCMSVRDRRAIRWADMKEAAYWQARHEFAARTVPGQIGQ